MGIEGDDLGAVFARNVRTTREFRKLSQRDLAARMGWTQNAVYRIERHQRRVDLGEAAALAAALEVTVDALLVSGYDVADDTQATAVRRALEELEQLDDEAHRIRQRLALAVQKLADLDPGGLPAGELRSTALAALALRHQT